MIYLYTLVGEKECVYFMHTNENSIQKKNVEDLACDQPRFVPQEHAFG